MKLAPHPFTLRQLQYVVAVADELSFRRAADRCRVSQPSLSAQLAQLEQAFDVRIFERDRRGVMLTSAGHDLVARARLILVAADDLMQAGRQASDPLAGPLSLGVIPTISPYLLPSLTPKLRKEFPRLTIAWLEDKTETLMTKLANGTIEAALVAIEADIGDVEREVIAHDPFVLVTPPQHPLAKKKSPVTNAELSQEVLLLLDDGHCFRQQALEVCSAAREGGFRATSLSTLVQMVAGGSGVTLLPALAVAAEAKRARLHVRPMAAPSARRTIALVWRARSARTAALHDIARAIRDAYPARVTQPKRR